jgi:hypothetical protein
MTTQDKNQTTTQDKNECYECGYASPRLRVRNNTGPQDCCEEQERPPQTLICDGCAEEAACDEEIEEDVPVFSHKLADVNEHGFAACDEDGLVWKYDRYEDEWRKTESVCDGDCDVCAGEEGKNWYIVEVEIDYKYYGHFAVYAKSGEDAEDEIGASDLGLGDRRYDTITLSASLYAGDVSEFDTDKFHEIEMPL